MKVKYLESDPEYETETNQSESSDEHYPSTSDGNFYYQRTRSINMLIIPLHFGFDRIQTAFNNKCQKCILYKTPCGKTIRNMKQMLPDAPTEK